MILGKSYRPRRFNKWLLSDAPTLVLRCAAKPGVIN